MSSSRRLFSVVYDGYSLSTGGNVTRYVIIASRSSVVIYSSCGQRAVQMTNKSHIVPVKWRVKCLFGNIVNTTVNYSTVQATVSW